MPVGTPRRNRLSASCRARTGSSASNGPSHWITLHTVGHRLTATAVGDTVTAPGVLPAGRRKSIRTQGPAVSMFLVFEGGSQWRN